MADCPWLPAGFQLPLLGLDGSEVTLEQLQAPDWWRCLPQELQSSWRRSAGSSKWLYAPAASDLEPPPASDSAAAGANEAVAATASKLANTAKQRQLMQQQQQKHSADALSHCALARALFWARWLLGEPIIVRGCEVSQSAQPVALHAGDLNVSMLSQWQFWLLVTPWQFGHQSV